MRILQLQWRRCKDAKLLILLGLCLLACVLAFLVEGNVGFSLWDEGYLWYGVQRTLLGEVPLRDFLSYDPGRYYWAASLLWIFHDHGIIGVRAATAAFMTIGSLAAVAFVWNNLDEAPPVRFLLGALTVLLCLLWAMPWWKQYDEATSIFLTLSLARVLALPVRRRFFYHGIVVGLAAILGRNHGIYGLMACLLVAPMLMFVVDRSQWVQCVLAWLGGIVLGFSPILVGILVDRHFALMFWDSIRFLLFEYRGTNLPLPVPWPWTVDGSQPFTPGLARSWLIGGVYVAMPLLCLLGLGLSCRSIWRDRQFTHPAFTACIATAIFYLNVAYSRADLLHLAQSVYPLMLGLMLWPYIGKSGVIIRGSCAGLFTAISLWIALPMHPLYLMHSQPGWRQIEVKGERLWMDASFATSVTDIEQLASRYIQPGGTLLSIPVWPGAYALLGLKSPVYEIYALFPRSDVFQNREIARLQTTRPSLVLFNDIAVDGRDDLRYAKTHPRILDYIAGHYRQISSPPAEPQLKVYVRQ